MLDSIIAFVAGSLAAGGVVAAIYGLTPHEVKPRRPIAWAELRPVRWFQALGRVKRIALASAFFLGVLLWLVAGWVVAPVLLPIAVLAAPVLWAVDDTEKNLEKLEALSLWCRNLAGLLQAEGNLIMAVVSSVRSCPAAIRPQVEALAARLSRQRMSSEAAFRQFGAELGDFLGDQAAFALVTASRAQGGRVAETMKQIADQVSAQVRARREAVTDRAGLGTNVRVLLIVSAVGIAVCAAGGWLDAYGSPVGQAIFIALLALYVGWLVLMRKIAVIPEPPRLIREGGNQ